MHKRIRLAIIKYIPLAIGLLLFIPLSLASGFAIGEELASIKSVDIQNFADGAKVNIASDRNVYYAVYDMDEPFRVVIDPVDDVLCKNTDDIIFNDASLTSIKFVKKDSALDFIVLTFREPFKYETSQESALSFADTFNVKIGSCSKSIEKKKEISAPQETQALKETPAMPVKEAVEKLQPSSEIEHESIIAHLLKDISCKNDAESARLILSMDKQVKFLVYPLEDPRFIVIDPIYDTYSNIKQKISFKQGIVKAIKVIKSSDMIPPDMDKSFYKVDILILELEKPADTSPQYSDSRFLLNIGQEQAPIPVITPALAGQELRIADSDILKKYGQIALSNHLPAKVAQEEITLAKYKRQEAWRGLLPTTYFKTSMTEGETLNGATTSSFKEQSFGIQVEQPLYYGGKLVNTLKQSRISLDLSYKRYSKIEADLALEVAQAYYDYVGAQANLKMQERLVSDLRILLDAAMRRNDLGLSTQIELLNAQAQYNQAQFQFISAQKDVSMNRLKFQNALSVKEGFPIQVPSNFQFKEVKINLDDALNTAFKNRPDILINDLLVKFNIYEQKIANAKGDFKIDFTGFLGRSGGAFTTEKLKMQSDWYMGFKVSKPFMWSTGDLSYTKQKTSPKLGENSRTNTESITSDAYLLNALGIRSEMKQSQIGYLKAVNELEQSKKQVMEEVKEAYYGYQKALLQVQNTFEKVNLRKRQLGVTKAEAGLNDAMESQVMEAEIRLADEQSLHNQALSSYNVSIAKMNKAIGIAGYYK